MRHILYAVIIPSFLFFPILQSEPIITFFFQPYPGASKDAIKLMKKFKQPQHLARHALESAVNHSVVVGIISSYAGYMEVSNIDGETIYPRKNSNPLFYLIITPQATPLLMNANTIDHWELEPGISAATYKVERMTDQETMLTYWNVQEAQLPQDDQLPLESIIIFAKPKYIYVPTGITITTNSENLVLPAMYVKKGLDVTNQALYLLNLAHYFRPLTTLYVKKSNQYSTAPAS